MPKHFQSKKRMTICIQISAFLLLCNTEICFIIHYFKNILNFSQSYQCFIQIENEWHINMGRQIWILKIMWTLYIIEVNRCHVFTIQELILLLATRQVWSRNTRNTWIVYIVYYMKYILSLHKHNIFFTYFHCVIVHHSTENHASFSLIT